jgi:hypothetical protein
MNVPVSQDIPAAIVIQTLMNACLPLASMKECVIIYWADITAHVYPVRWERIVKLILMIAWVKHVLMVVPVSIRLEDMSATVRLVIMGQIVKT